MSAGPLNDPPLAPWLVALFSEMGRARPAVEQAMIDAGARVIAAKCETGHYWAGAVAREVFDAMAKAFSHG